MKKEIVINSSSSQNRVGIIEDGNLVDFFVENPEKRKMVGDIYLGKVARVLPGIRAAFIDIGLKHDAFLHFSDIGERLEALSEIIEDDDDTEIEEIEDDNEDVAVKKNEKKDKERPITKLHKGQEIIVQIIKEPVGEKGVRITSSISLPGRFCVLLPFDDKIGVSKRISDYKERRRLRNLARSILPKNSGLIIRTAARQQSEESLSNDVKNLLKTWEEMLISVKHKKPPSLIYQDVKTTTSVIRDLFTHDVSQVFVDSKKLYREITSYLQMVQPALVDKVKFFKGNAPIFETFKIEEQIKTLMGRKVPLPSGGHIVIDHSEAMIVIDVNSGRYAAKKEQELNSLKTDLEAAREIARQLKLRDIGGLIVVDFIDLEDDKNRKKIYDELKKEFKKDRAKMAMLPMTDFGLMQITRQRIRENILQSTHEACPYCLGTGLLTKKSNLLHEIEEWFKRYKNEGRERSLVLNVHPSLGLKLREGKISRMAKLQFKYLLRLKLVEDEKMNPSEIKILSSRSGEDLTEEFS